MRRYVFRLAVLAMTVLGPSLAFGDDQQIAKAVVQKLQEEKKQGSLKGFSIDLQVEDGTVWLSGRVASADQEARALDVARRIPGVVQVVNDLSIGAAASTVQPASGYEDAPSMSQAMTRESAVGTGVHPVSNTTPVYNAPAQAQPRAVVPVYAGTRSAVPMAFAPARTVSHQGEAMGMPGQPMPMHTAGTGMGVAPARYDHPSMPGYAWPSYASHPNYAAVTYPKQYSPTAWPYIGPFYPYPQVPLGWRKVTLEWDDGWWFLDFKDRRH
ncbi:transport-associated [Pirellula staleyi DSM 6068]|uniref:Transport-associated n=1 Tax=Pirellula staleyi (strain ATCC 27377 / DSM 6068 / ICPB 4128) TaxID=530564 RepID=D2R5S3_PIRSD|nr:BON domain-containing protein [Pirellula staleyi]ADB17255.1 transport-associated [Pirellula staleyi DSM 6068]